jgi:hypothetical protein
MPEPVKDLSYGIYGDEYVTARLKGTKETMELRPNRYHILVFHGIVTGGYEFGVLQNNGPRRYQNVGTVILTLEDLDQLYVALA